MPEQSIIVWDLETVPDLPAAARMLDLGNAADADVREALGPGFPKHPLHKIVCIGALVASRQPEGWRMDALGAPHIGERPEAKLISDFVERIGQLRPSNAIQMRALRSDFGIKDDWPRVLCTCSKSRMRRLRRPILLVSVPSGSFLVLEIGKTQEQSEGFHLFTLNLSMSLA